uniref:Uncharacterized protein n=1 Tax=Sinocyclocheilus rhinocerous TaxID=307959 RepID=A0A673FMI4_9TELE
NVCRQEELIGGMKAMGILDIQNMPCARESILHGAGGSLVDSIKNKVIYEGTNLDPPINYLPSSHPRCI